MLRSMPVMDDETPSPEMNDQVPAPDSTVDAEPAPPIHSRFLFVDVAALRAKQLRRGRSTPLWRSGHPASAEEGGAARDGGSAARPGAIRRAAMEARRARPRICMTEVQQLIAGVVRDLASSTMFVLALFIGFCVIFGFTKLKKTAGGRAMVVKSLDERISQPADGICLADRSVRALRSAQVAGTRRGRRT